MKRLILTSCLVVLPAVALATQEPPKPREKQETQERQEKREPPAPRPPVDTGQVVNVKVDITISEQAGSAAAQTKNVSIVAADGNTGRIRSYNPLGGARAGELNVDVRPRLVQGGRVRVDLVVEYRPFAQGASEAATPGLSESMTVYLQEGKPLVVSQSADPNSDRRVTLEVRAQVLR
ncbi:MAG TPA: hypothetical protein VK886_17320 [Vicinamibacterales bacterium]|nr:hypothetical protein [Vicinamibacterales bacterium]